MGGTLRMGVIGPLVFYNSKTLMSYFSHLVIFSLFIAKNKQGKADETAVAELATKAARKEKG